MTLKADLVLVPGLSCNRTLWAGEIDALADLANISVPVLDSYETIGDMADGILASAPPRFAVAGVSMGGYVCLEIARRAPQRVMGLGLFNTTARPETRELTERRMNCVELIRRGQFLPMLKRLLPRMVHQEQQDNPEFCRRLIGMAVEVGPETFIRHQWAMIKRRDSRDILSRIGCPTLVLVGEDDHLTELWEHEEMAETIPNANLVLIDKAAHLAAMERPAEVSDAMRSWLHSIAVADLPILHSAFPSHPARYHDFDTPLPL